MIDAGYLCAFRLSPALHKCTDDETAVGQKMLLPYKTGRLCDVGHRTERAVPRRVGGLSAAGGGEANHGLHWPIDSVLIDASRKCILVSVLYSFRACNLVSLLSLAGTPKRIKIINAL